MGKSWQNPRVSMVIPTYNLGETLPACLKNKVIRGYPHRKTVIVDNFSNNDPFVRASRTPIKRAYVGLWQPTGW